MHSHFSTILLSLLAALPVGFIIGETTGLLTSFSLTVSFWLLIHLYHTARLYNWLQNPKLSTIPKGRGIWKDISDTLLRQAKSRKKSKQKRAKALFRLNRIAEAMPNGILVLDSNGRIKWMNPTAAGHLNLNPHLDRSRILKSLIHAPEFHAFLHSGNRQALPEISLTVPDTYDGLRTVLLSRTAFGQGNTLLVTQDITSAERLNTARADFVANVSHELRTPLTVINGFLETLTDFPDLPVEQRQECLGLMQDQGKRMLDLIADLLTLSRLEDNQHTDHNRQPVNLSELTYRLCKDGLNFSDGLHHFHTDIAPDIWVNGISMDLYNAFSNLVFNAVRYTPEGGSITVSLQACGPNHNGHGQARFSITDTGSGIAPEHFPRLTERFYRVDRGRTRQQGGTGLGLAITKHALAKHQSLLEVESEVGKGSTFSAKLDTVPPPEALP